MALLLLLLFIRKAGLSTTPSLVIAFTTPSTSGSNRSSRSSICSFNTGSVSINRPIDFHDGDVDRLDGDETIVSSSDH